MLVERRREILPPEAGFTTMEMGWLLAGLAAARAAGVGVAGLAELAAGVAAKLCRCQREPAGLFSFGIDLPRRNRHAARYDARLGSFACQVYPIVGLASHGRAAGDDAALAAARRGAAAICARQGPAGQWWWIYHAGPGRIALRYPVYTVHQDSMGPMALLATGEPGAFAAPLRRSLAWLADPPELTGETLLPPEHSLVWRAVQREQPDRTGKLGLGRWERLRLHLAAWTGRADHRPTGPMHLCPECRPYHLGWILLAGALLEEGLP
jgi:hypothetical protein